MTIARKLATLRKDAGLTVIELTVKSGVSRAAIHAIEAGTRKPSLETARKLCKAMGVSLSEFDK